MRLTDLVRAALPQLTVPPSRVEVAAVTDRSSQVTPGAVFVAIPGVSVDGHNFIDEAVANGAIAVFGTRRIKPRIRQAHYFQVSNSRRALGRLLHAFHGFPMQGMVVVGITGTNGKSTTAYAVESILRAAGRRPGLIGTIEYRFGAGRELAAQTTPHPAVLIKYVQEMKRAGLDSLVMEVSSHALVQDRVEAVPFRVAALTNITHEHHDFHGSFQSYAEAKYRLFGEFLARSPEGVAVFNLDDPMGLQFSQRYAGWAVTYGKSPPAEVRASNVQSDHKGLRLKLETPIGSRTVRSRLVGDYNVPNILAATASGIAAQLPLEAIVAGIESLPGVPGRFERLEVSAPFDVYVDFAHTPDALEQVLGSARRLLRGGRLICVFGAGGDRDSTKRGPMGAAVARLADRAIITKDNSRLEDPERIAAMLAAGMDSVREGRGGGCPYDIILDRGEAIRTALSEARKGDLVFIAGKGHELYENEGGELRPWDDRKVVQEALGQK